MMLEFLGWNAEGAALNNAVKAAVHESFVTPDLGGAHKTGEVGDWLAKFVSDSGTTRSHRESI
jgi:isocitrate/isopropylmalate dehydrogenase